MYTLYDNLLSERGTTRIYNESLDLVRANPRIRSLFGTSVVGFGEPSTRHRNRGYAHQESIDALGRKCVSLKYYIVDSKMRNEPELVGEVEAELAESQNTGTWDYNRVTVTAYHTKGALNPEVIPVFVTDEYLREVQRQDELRRNRRFSSRDRGSSDGSWFSTLNPANWRKGYLRTTETVTVTPTSETTSETEIESTTTTKTVTATPTSETSESTTEKPTSSAPTTCSHTTSGYGASEPNTSETSETSKTSETSETSETSDTSETSETGETSKTSDVYNTYGYDTILTETTTATTTATDTVTAEETTTTTEELTETDITPLTVVTTIFGTLTMA
ncbi:hypothetical protein GGF46_002184 [Coemansia sp. RSA 552]|nr:hypothetical protein GGF46_002184 [Coemansia sp. RSA 552]